MSSMLQELNNVLFVTVRRPVFRLFAIDVDRHVISEATYRAENVTYNKARHLWTTSSNCADY